FPYPTLFRSCRRLLRIWLVKAIGCLGRGLVCARLLCSPARILVPPRQTGDTIVHTCGRQDTAVLLCVVLRCRCRLCCNVANLARHGSNGAQLRCGNVRWRACLRGNLCGSRWPLTWVAA